MAIETTGSQCTNSVVAIRTPDHLNDCCLAGPSTSEISKRFHPEGTSEKSRTARRCAITTRSNSMNEIHHWRPNESLRSEVGRNMKCEDKAHGVNRLRGCAEGHLLRALCARFFSRTQHAQ